MFEGQTTAIDPRTVCLLGGLVALLSAAAVGLLRGLHERSAAAVTTIAWALVAHAVSMLLAAANGALGDVDTMRASFAALAASAVLTAVGLRALYGQPTRQRLVNYALGAATLLALLLPGGRAPLFAMFATQAACAAVAAHAVFAGREPGAPMGRVGLLALLGVLGLGATARAFGVAAGHEVGLAPDAMRVGPLPGLVLMLYALAPIVLMTLGLKVVYGRLVADVRQQAVTDELTGLASRRYLFGHGDPWLTARGQSANFTALMMIDVDHFKSINDRFGHDTGDRVLRHVAVVLRGALRSDSVLARYGGEEFCALVPVADQTEAEAAAERVRDAVESQPFPIPDGCIDVTVSIGLAFHRPGLTLREVLRTADRRVYYAKACGRNRVIGEIDTLQAAIV